MKDNKEYFQDIILKDYIDIITDYHSNGAYQKLKENVTLKYEEDYAIMVRTLNFEANNFDSNLIYINEEEYNFLSKSKVYEDDILMNKIANAGSVYIMPKNNKPTSLAMNLFLIRFNDLLNQRYMYYLMKTNESYIKNFANGTSTLTITKESVKNLKFQVPSLLIQEKIASILSNLDKKIELNNQINQKLEAMSKTLYDYWFVQFDFPDADGKLYKSSGGKMVYSEELKREIPEGWEVNSLWNIANYFNGLAMQKHRPTTKEFLRVIKIKEMNEGFSDKTEHAKIDINEKAIVNNGDILFSWSATLDVKIWTQGIGALNQHIFKVTSQKYPKTFFYFELLNYLQHFKMMAEKRKTTMGHITQEHLKQSRIVIPPNDLIKILDKKLKPMLDKKVLLEVENQKLTQLRDWLLPMLMNGQVGIK